MDRKWRAGGCRSWTGRATRFLAVLAVALSAALLAPIARAAGPELRAPVGTSGAGPSAAVHRPVLVNLFWDRRWNADVGATGLTRAAINGFLGELTESGYFEALRQYGVRRPRLVASIVATSGCGAKAPSAVTPAQVARLVACEMASGALPAAGIGLVVNVLLPPGTHSDLAAPGRCLGSGGAAPPGLYNYHGSTANHVAGVAVPFTVVAAGCALAGGGGIFGSPFDHFTWALTHEVDEAVTDPLPGYGWIDAALGRNGEAADLCEPAGTGATRAVPFGRGLVTRYWSNRAAACVVGLARRDGAARSVAGRGLETVPSTRSGVAPRSGPAEESGV